MSQTEVSQQRLQDIICSTVPIDYYRPIFIWGSPGIGKSQIVKQAAKKINYEVVDLRLQLMGPLDIRGIPFYDESSKKAVWAPPSMLPYENKPGILFLDELPTAPRAVQASTLQLILDRRSGEYELPSKWKIIAAGNDLSDNLASHDVIAPLANRFIHLNLKPNFYDWFMWAIDIGGINPIVIDFIIRHTEYFIADGNTNTEDSIKSFPTPRSWEFVSDTINTLLGPLDYPDHYYLFEHTDEEAKEIQSFEKNQLSDYINNIADNDMALPLVSGAVGDAAALSFTAFLKKFDSNIVLPNPRLFVRAAAIDMEDLSKNIKKMVEDSDYENIFNYFKSVCDHCSFWVDKIAEQNDSALGEKIDVLLGILIRFVQETKGILSKDIHVVIRNLIDASIVKKYNKYIEEATKTRWNNLSKRLIV